MNTVRKKNWFQRIPGVVKTMTAIVTALAGLFAALAKFDIIGGGASAKATKSSPSEAAATKTYDGYILTFSDGRVMHHPDSTAIQLAIQELPNLEDKFAILSRVDDPNTYMQTMRHGSDDFGLEYQEGTTHQHYWTYQQKLTEEQVVFAMQQYANSEKTWKEHFQWQNEIIHVRAFVKSAVYILGSLSMDQAQKVLDELKGDAPASPDPKKDIVAMLDETTTMEQAVKILTALQDAKSSAMRPNQTTQPTAGRSDARSP